MARYDALSADQRHWLAAAALPWSPCSVRRLWDRLAREHGDDIAAILHRMDAAEARLLLCDARKVWGENYPGPAAEDTSDAG